MIRAVALAQLLAACAPHATLSLLPPALAGPFDAQNPFAQIIRGERPADAMPATPARLAFAVTDGGAAVGWTSQW